LTTKPEVFSKRSKGGINDVPRRLTDYAACAG
jgi:hypothetical protein